MYAVAAWPQPCVQGVPKAARPLAGGQSQLQTYVAGRVQLACVAAYFSQCM